MDPLDELVEKACRCIRHGRVVSARSLLQRVTRDAGELPVVYTRSVGVRAYAWLTWVRKAADTAGLGGARVDADTASPFAEDVSLQQVLDRFRIAVEAILVSATAAHSANQPIVVRAKQYMESGYERGIRIADVADAVGCRGRSLRRFWRREEARDGSAPTPSAYLQRCRVEGAKPFLEFTARSIEEIAETVGYRSVRGLEYAFKKHEMMTPSEYRERIRSQHGTHNDASA